MNQWVITRAAVMGGLILVACGPKTSDDEDEPTASDLAAVATGNVERALHGTVRAGGFLADSATIADSLGAMSDSYEECTYPPCTNGVCPPAECVTVEEEVTVDDLRQGRADMDESIDSLVKELRERIFTKDNLESESDGAATYLLGPKALCSSDGDSASEGTSSTGPSPSPQASQPSEPALDPDCVEQANRWQIRLRLSSPSEGNVDVALLLTASKRNPATLELHSNHVGVVVDLGEVKATLDALGEDTGALVSLVGKLDFQLRKNGELDYSFLASVLEDVNVGVESDVGEAVRVGVGRSVPTFELRLDGNARQVTGTIDVGAITVGGPLNAFRDMFDPEEYDSLGNPIPRPTYQGDVQGLLAGIEEGLTFDGSTDKLTLKHIGLGDQTSTLEVDRVLVAALDVNPAAGRHFDMVVEKQSAGTLITFVPTLDATLLMKLAPLASQIADISPSLLDNTFHFWFDGQNPSVLAGNDQLRVVSGTLNYAESYDPSHNVTASAGSCVATDSDTSSGFVVTTCQ